ncbi:MAG TPA: hypothetical protein VE288_10985 [Rubrobacteraceae bacterium]|jgi:hypothetical protein|nr:hypothetical protein [Rubrobacteraceae bacterium]
MEHGLQNPNTRSSSRCDHASYPALVTRIKTGSYYACCLGCLTTGPERSSKIGARRALTLTELAAGNLERNVHRSGVAVTHATTIKEKEAGA